MVSSARRRKVRRIRRARKMGSSSMSKPPSERRFPLFSSGLFNLPDTGKAVKRVDLRTDKMAPESTLADEKEILRVDVKAFSENGLVVMGLLGGFALATLALVISAQHTFEPNSLDWSIGIKWPGGSQITSGEVYLFSLETLLGIVGFWSITVSFVMLLISSSKHPELFKSSHKFAGVSVAVLCGGFAGILALLVAPFSPASSWTIIGASLIITGVMFVLRKEDKNRYLNDKKTTTIPNAIPTGNDQNKREDSLPAASSGRKAK